jgi:hypothetical protein
LPCKDGFRWIVNSGSLHRSQTDFPLDLQRQFFDSPCTFLVVGAEASGDYKDWKAVKTRTITTITALDAAVSDPETGAVLYDPEAWEMTPREEQTDPVSATCQAASVAHARHKILIATPAINLIRFLAPGAAANGQRFAAFEKAQIAGRIAKCADVYEIQAQGAEMDVDKFREFVEGEAAQARRANSRAIVRHQHQPNGPACYREDAFQIRASSSR